MLVAGSDLSAVNGKFPGDRPLDPASIEEWTVQFTNEERIKASLQPLKHDLAISDIARTHSEQMIQHGYGHVVKGMDATDRALAAGYDCRAYHEDGGYSYGLSENIFEYPRIESWEGTRYWGLFDSGWEPTIYEIDERETAHSLVEGWMNSLGHRANILDQENRRIGVGVAVELSEKHGWTLETFYATQNFSGCE